MYDLTGTVLVKESEHLEDLQRLRGFRPIDDDFMRGLFRDNIELVQLVLRIILGKNDLVITECETQADMKRVTGARSVSLDAYGTDSEGKKYDIEIQRSDTGAGPKRARYHSSVMDVENLNAGQDFEELPETYTIFITENDYIGDGDAVYFYEMKNQKGYLLGDGAHIVYVNGKYRGDDDIGMLMHDFNCVSAKDMHFSLLSEKTKYLKETQEGVDMMCKAMEDMRNEAEARGEARGVARGMTSGIIKLGRDMGLSDEMIADKLVAICSISKDDAEKILRPQIS